MSKTNVAFTGEHSGTKSKLDRYGWTLKDKPGKMRFVEKELLQVDPLYQRDANETRTLRLASSWSWIACGAIVVASRGKRLFVVDGQHRVLAACRRADIRTLPCLVFETEDASEEAVGFLTINTNRRTPRSNETFKAGLCSGDPHAILIDRLLIASGRRAASFAGSGVVSCLGAMMFWAKNAPAPLERTWPIVSELALGKSVHNRLLHAMMYIELRMPDGQSLSDTKWKRRVLSVGNDEILTQIGKAAAYYSSGGHRVWAAGALEAINKRLQKPIVLRDKASR